MISPATIQRVARCIAERFHPVRVVLFGSYARGEAREDSDVDLLVVVDCPGPRGRRSAPIIRALAEQFTLPIDVIVRSREDVDRYRHSAGTLVAEAMKEGVVLYERG